MGNPEIRLENCNFKNTICQFNLPMPNTISLPKPIELTKRRHRGWECRKKTKKGFKEDKELNVGGLRKNRTFDVGLEDL